MGSFTQLLVLSISALILFSSYVCCISEQENLINMVNQYRQQNGLPSVPSSYWLTATGMLHTIDRRDNGLPTGCSSGHSWSSTSTKFNGCCYSAAAWECMCLKPDQVSNGRFTGISYETWITGAGSAEVALNAWKNSPSHNSVILNLDGWAGSPWKSIGAGVCGGNYALWFSTQADPDGGADISSLTCGMSVNGPVPAPRAAGLPLASASQSSVPVASLTPSRSSAPSKTSTASLTSSISKSSVPSRTSTPSLSSVASQSSSKSSVPSLTSTASLTSSISKSSVPSQSSTPSVSSVPASTSSVPSLTSTPSISSVASQSPVPSPQVQSPKLWIGGTTVKIASDPKDANSWTTMTMNQLFVKPVVVCSMYYTADLPPLTLRMQDVVDRGNTFKVQVIGNPNYYDASVDVDCIAVEAGTYTVAEHGIKMEANRVDSTITNGYGSWGTGNVISYSNGVYQSPIVVGQVMTANDDKWSVFYSHSTSSPANPVPSPGSGCLIGKHAGEDKDLTRVTETLGYIVIESGSGIWGSRKYSALRSNAAYGVTNNPSSFVTPVTGIAPTAGVNSMNSIRGPDGGYSIFYGNRYTAYQSGVWLAVDEDAIGDAERSHSSAETIGALLFE